MSGVSNAGRRRALPAATLARLTELPAPRRADAHAFAIMMSLVNCGHDEHEAYALLVDPAHYGGLAVQRRHQKGAGIARRWVFAQWQRAVAKVAASPAVGDERELQASLARIAHAVEDRVDLWRGQAGASRRAVLLGVLYFATKAKNATLRVSERQLGAHLQMRQATVNAALRWHREQGLFLRRAEAGSGLRGSTYTVFYNGPVQGRISSSPSGGVQGTDTPLQPVSDAASRAGIGPNAHRILSLLPTYSRVKLGERGASPTGDAVRVEHTSPIGDGGAISGVYEAKENADGPVQDHVQGMCSGRGRCRCRHVRRTDAALLQGLTVTDVVERVGLHITTVKRQLERLAALGLVASDAEGRLAALPYDERQLSLVLGVVGAGARRRAAFAAQQDQWQRREAARAGHVVVDDESGRHVVDPRTGEVIFTQRSAPAAEADRVCVMGREVAAAASCSCPG